MWHTPDAELQNHSEYPDVNPGPTAEQEPGAWLAFGTATGYLPFNVGAAVQGPSVPNQLAERILSERDTLNLLADWTA